MAGKDGSSIEASSQAPYSTLSEEKEPREASSSGASSEANDEIEIETGDDPAVALISGAKTSDLKAGVEQKIRAPLQIRVTSPVEPANPSLVNEAAAQPTQLGRNGAPPESANPPLEADLGPTGQVRQSSASSNAPARPSRLTKKGKHSMASVNTQASADATPTNHGRRSSATGNTPARRSRLTKKGKYSNASANAEAEGETTPIIRVRQCSATSNTPTGASRLTLPIPSTSAEAEADTTPSSRGRQLSASSNTPTGASRLTLPIPSVGTKAEADTTPSSRGRQLSASSNTPTGASCLTLPIPSVGTQAEGDATPTNQVRTSASSNTSARRSRLTPKGKHSTVSAITQAEADATPTNQVRSSANSSISARRSRLTPKGKPSTVSANTQAEADASPTPTSLSRRSSASSSAQADADSSPTRHSLTSSNAESLHSRLTKQSNDSITSGSTQAESDVSPTSKSRRSSWNSSAQETVHEDSPSEYNEQEDDPDEEKKEVEEDVPPEEEDDSDDERKVKYIAPSPKIRVVASKSKGGLSGFINGLKRKDPMKRLVGYEEDCYQRFYIGGLPSDCDADTLRERFTEYGSISAEDVVLHEEDEEDGEEEPKKKVKKKKYGHITFEGENSLDDKLEGEDPKITMSGTELTVKMYLHSDRRFYIGGLPDSCVTAKNPAKKLREHFEQYGDISPDGVVVVTQRRCGYISFEGENSLETETSKIIMSETELEVKMYMPQAEAPKVDFGSEAANKTEYKKVAKRLVSKGFSVEWLLKFWRTFGDRPKDLAGPWTWDDGSVSKVLKPAKGRWKGRINRESSTNDVVKHLVIPDSAADRCCYMDLVPHTAVRPQKLVSHWWGANFLGDVLCILQDATGLTGESLAMYVDYDYAPGLQQSQTEILRKSYWMCIFAVNQHVSICGTCNDCDVVSTGRSCSVCQWPLFNPCPCGTMKRKTGHLLCEMDKFDIVMGEMKDGLAVALDSNVKTLTRVWVLSEIGKSFEEQLRITWMMPNEIADRFCLDKDQQLVPIRECSASLQADKDRILQQIDESLKGDQSGTGLDQFDTNVNDKVLPILRRYALVKLVMKRMDEGLIEMVLNRRKDDEEHLADSEVSTGKSVLHEAASSGQIEALRHLLEARANIDNKDSSGATAIFVSAEKAITETDEKNKKAAAAVLEYLLKAKANVDTPNKAGVTPLHMAAGKKEGNVEIVNTLLARKADVNHKNNQRQISLHRAAQAGHTAIVEVLLAAKGDLNKADKQGRTPLAIAKIENSLSKAGFKSDVEISLHKAGARIFPSRKDLVLCERNNSHKLDKKSGSGETCSDCELRGIDRKIKLPDHVFRCSTCKYYLCEECHHSKAEKAEELWLQEQTQKEDDLRHKKEEEKEAKRLAAQKKRRRKGFFQRMKEKFFGFLQESRERVHDAEIDRTRRRDIAARTAKAKAQERADTKEKKKVYAKATQEAKSQQQTSPGGKKPPPKKKQPVAAIAVKTSVAKTAPAKKKPAAATPKASAKDTPKAAAADQSRQAAPKVTERKPAFRGFFTKKVTSTAKPKPAAAAPKPKGAPKATTADKSGAKKKGMFSGIAAKAKGVVKKKPAAAATKAKPKAAAADTSGAKKKGVFSGIAAKAKGVVKKKPAAAAPKAKPKAAPKKVENKSGTGKKGMLSGLAAKAKGATASAKKPAAKEKPKETPKPATANKSGATKKPAAQPVQKKAEPEKKAAPAKSSPAPQKKKAAPEKKAAPAKSAPAPTKTKAPAKAKTEPPKPKPAEKKPAAAKSQPKAKPAEKPKQKAPPAKAPAKAPSKPKTPTAKAPAKAKSKGKKK